MSIRAAQTTRRPRRWRRRLRAVAVVGICALAVAGVMQLVVPAAAQVGHLRSAEGRQDYLEACRATLAQLPEPAATTDVPTRYGTVRVYEWSSPDHDDRRPVVLLPGLSSQSVPLETMADQVAWLDDVLTAVSPGEGVHLVGHSFGGATAAACARAHPQRVTTLSLLEPVFILGSPQVGIYLWSAILLLPTPQSWRERAMAEIGGEEVSEADADDPLVAMIDAGARQHSAHLPTPTVLTADQLGKLTMPVHVGLGELSTLAGGAEAADKARAHLPDATTTIWPGTTHSLPLLVPDELAAELITFWDTTDRG